MLLPWSVTGSGSAGGVVTATLAVAPTGRTVEETTFDLAGPGKLPLTAPSFLAKVFGIGEGEAGPTT